MATPGRQYDKAGKWVIPDGPKMRHHVANGTTRPYTLWGSGGGATDGKTRHRRGAGGQEGRADQAQRPAEADLRSIASDIDHLGGAIALFANSAGQQRYVRQYRAKKGLVRRFVLAMLRDATEPVSTREITDRWCKERGLKIDAATWAILRNCMGATLIALRAQTSPPASGSSPTAIKTGDWPSGPRHPRDKPVVNEGMVGDLRGWCLDAELIAR